MYQFLNLHLIKDMASPTSESLPESHRLKLLEILRKRLPKYQSLRQKQKRSRKLRFIEKFPTHLLSYRKIEHPLLHCPKISRTSLIPVPTTEEDRIPFIKIDNERAARCQLALNMEQLRFVVEGLLCYTAYLLYASRDCVTKRAQTKAKENLVILRKALVDGVGRGESGNHGYSYQKFVEMAHVLTEIPDFGPAGARETGVMERLLKTFAVAPQRHSQKRSHETVNRHVAKNNAESVLCRGIVDATLRLYPEMDILKQMEPNAPREEFIDRDGAPPVRGKYIFHSSRAKPRFERSADSNIIERDDGTLANHLLRLCSDNYGDEEIALGLVNEATVVVDGDRLTLRAHPDFCGAPWYDCVFIKREGESVAIPARVCAIINGVVPGGKLGSNTFPAPSMLVVQVATRRERGKDVDSPILESWRWENTRINDDVFQAILRNVKISDVTGYCRCIDCFATTGTGGYKRSNAEDFDMLRLKSMRTEWPNSFIRLQEYIT